MVDNNYNPSGHKASEVVELLQKVISEHGDLPVQVVVGYDSYGFNTEKSGKLSWINIENNKVVLSGDEV